ncbi:c-type cytochrome biogenesis protein CcmI [Pseudomonas sp. Marseille-QA0892]
MIELEFWIGAGLLCLAALGLLLIPLLRKRTPAHDTDRTALNVALYEERLRDVEEALKAGTVREPDAQAARDEAARTLLTDTDRAEPSTRGRTLGRTVPIAMAMLVPVCAVLLYAHWGSIGEVQRAHEMANTAQSQPRSVEDMTARLEQAVKTHPDAPEGWYYLGRLYLAQGRPAEAADALEQAVALSGRTPNLLGLWAQAQYFAAERQWSPQIEALTQEALAADPNEVSSLGLIGIAAYDRRQYQKAIDYWQRLATVMPAGDPARQPILESINRARQQLSDGPADTAGSPVVQVRIELADTVRGQVEPVETVFVFARATDGPPMPLAVKRLRVADLPTIVRLTDADAMMPDLKLSAFPRIEVVARVSRSGNAQQGEWIGLGSPIDMGSTGIQQVVIDRADTDKP